nr:MAG TPA: hypothetical protein [Caudoviricetes sp.]
MEQLVARKAHLKMIKYGLQIEWKYNRVTCYC